MVALRRWQLLSEMCYDFEGDNMVRKLNGLQVAQQIAKQRRGRCLSSEYKNVDTKILWECDKSHSWQATLYKVKNRSQWCPICADKIISTKLMLQNGIETAKKVAKEKEGKCLSVIYKNIHTKMLWKCKNKHIWKASLAQVKK